MGRNSRRSKGRNSRSYLGRRRKSSRISCLRRKRRNLERYSARR